MPWAIWLVGAVLAAMEIPRLGSSVAGYLVAFTNLVSQFVEKAAGAALAGRISAPAGPPPPWLRFGWTGLVWLATVVVLCVWIAIKIRMGHSGHGLANVLIVIVGWPICFHMAKRVASAAPR